MAPKIRCQLKSYLFVVANWMGGRSAEPRLPQTHKFMKDRVLICLIRMHIGANTDDQEQLYKK